MWLFLLLLGLTTYYIIKRNTAPLTRTPVWLLWLVLMTPASLWMLWALVYGEERPLPPWLLFGPFIICPWVYWWLVQRGRITSPPAEDGAQAPEPEKSETKLRPINAQEEKSLRDCFPWGIYYLQQLDYRPQAILCRGKLQTAPEMAYERIKTNVEGVFGDRFLVLFQESFQGQPFFALVPNPSLEPKAEAPVQILNRPWLALALLLITLFTTTVVGAEMAGVRPEDLEANSQVLLKGLPYSLGIVLILACHEGSHYLAALFYRIKTTLPYFIPVPFFLGTFGAFIQMKSPVPHRRALFDVAIAGPLGGFVVALPLLWWGLTQSQLAPIAETSSLLSFDHLDPRFSLLLAATSKLALGEALKPGLALDLHPAAIAGYLGLIVTALNLMPFGQLDGGHIIHAMLGQRAAVMVGQLTRIMMVIFALIHRDFFLWAILLLLMPAGDQPALNDVTELDNRRDLLGVGAMILLACILLPVPAVLARSWSL
ncbi:MAG: site-2 protease family protein [Cyanobacteriota bacterium]|nr:site-2 protease family protein [Cyanobacteriota bacterium]